MASRCLVLDLETVNPHDGAEEKPTVSEHQVITAGMLWLNDDLSLHKASALSVRDGRTEADVIEAVIGELDDDTVLVTWNGRAFDVPVLVYRCMHLKIPCPWFFKKGVDNRYNRTGHYDLRDHMNFVGAAWGIDLDRAAHLVGLPGKLGTDGSDVSNLYRANRINKIETYCVTDVLQTAAVYVRWLFVMGVVSPEELELFHMSIRNYQPTQGTVQAAFDLINSEVSIF